MIVEVSDLKCIIMMYHDFDLQRKQQKKIFMNYKNLDTEKFLHQTQSDVLIK